MKHKGKETGVPTDSVAFMLVHLRPFFFLSQQFVYRWNEEEEKWRNSQFSLTAMFVFAAVDVHTGLQGDPVHCRIAGLMVSGYHRSEEHHSLPVGVGRLAGA